MTRRTPQKSSPKTSDHTFSVNDFPVTIRGALPLERVEALLGAHAIKKNKSQPVVTVEFVDDMNIYEEGGGKFSPDILLGDGFALDYANRTILYPATAPLQQKLKNLGEQNPLTRTIVFCIALLAERLGMQSVACKSALFQAPVYLHASAVLTPRGALVFCGECTFGKTTISTKLLKDYPLLEDDQVTILTPQLDAKKPAPPRVVIFGDSRQDAKQRKLNRSRALTASAAPLAGIFWLKKDPENALEPMEQTEAAGLLLNPMSNWQHAPSIRNRLQLFRSVLQAVPCKRLAFKKEGAPLVEFLKAQGYA